MATRSCLFILKYLKTFPEKKLYENEPIYVRVYIIATLISKTEASKANSNDISIKLSKYYMVTARRASYRSLPNHTIVFKKVSDI